MPETKPQRIKRLRRERNRRRKLRSNLLNRAEQHAKRIKAINTFLKKLLSDGVPGMVNGWHVKAIRNQVQSGIGAYINVPAKLVWHTTEGTSLPGYSGSHPHFTLDFKRKLLYQHIPVTSGAMALVHQGVETNRAHAIQVELVGFAAQSQDWTAADYAEIAKLARWIERWCDVERNCSVTFVGHGQTNHLADQRWLQYSGHLGHQHVPSGNSHWDPGEFRIDWVI